MAMTGNGEWGFDSGEGGGETATTSKEGRRANYAMVFLTPESLGLVLGSDNQRKGEQVFFFFFFFFFF